MDITLEPNGKGGNFLKRIRFSPNTFNETSATTWWATHKKDIVRQHALVPLGSGIQADLESPSMRWVCVRVHARRVLHSCLSEPCS